MRSFFLIGIGFLFMHDLLHAQTSFYEDLDMGKHSIGFCDTLLYDSSQTYSAYGYKGPSPLFVQIWFPLQHEVSGNYLPLKDLRNKNLPPDLQKVYDVWRDHSDSIFIETSLSENLTDGSALRYKDKNISQAMQRCYEIGTRSKRSAFHKNSSAPVIVYHHGTMGLPEENYVLAEYLASHGFIFISANFHLPNENSPFGYTEVFSATTDRAAFLLKQARLFSNGPLTFMGHSWGAQIGWRMLHKEGLADRFVSLETTIERKTDSVEIQDKWAMVYESLRTKGHCLHLPVLMLAYTGKDRSFPFFVPHSKGPTWFIGSKKYFDHESYTSVFHVRYLLRKEWKHPDRKVMKQQLTGYTKHLQVIRMYLQTPHLQNSKWVHSMKSDFYIHHQ